MHTVRCKKKKKKMVSAFNLFVFFLISTIANVKDQSLIPTTSIIFPAMLAVFVHRINVFISKISNVVWSSLSAETVMGGVGSPRPGLAAPPTFEVL